MAHWSQTLINISDDISQISNYDAKLEIAGKLIEMARPNQVIGAGSGSTALIALHELAKVDRENDLNLTFIPTSHEIEWACYQIGVRTTNLTSARPDWCFDGADEVDPDANLIKGRGGAMYREKLVMAASPLCYILVDESKFVKRLGEKFPVPVECDPAAIHIVEKALREMGATGMDIRLAKGKDGPIITEKGNIIIDTVFESINAEHEKHINAIAGVLESGLFWEYSPKIMSL